MNAAELSDLINLDEKKTNWSDFWLGVTVITVTCMGAAAAVAQLWT